MISRSAWSAPEAFIACRMEMMFWAVAPTEFNAPTTSPTFAVAGNTIELAFCSFALTSVLSATTVVPGLNGGG